MCIFRVSTGSAPNIVQSARLIYHAPQTSKIDLGIFKYQYILREWTLFSAFFESTAVAKENKLLINNDTYQVSME
jgi:hypothetical protein